MDGQYSQYHTLTDRNDEREILTYGLFRATYLHAQCEVLWGEMSWNLMALAGKVGLPRC
jgi:hypothetical protein